MATPRKTTAPKKTAAAARPEVPRNAVPGAVPLVELVTGDNVDDGMVTPLFSIDGVWHYIPSAPDAGMALRYLDRVSKGDREGALAVMLSELLGPASYQALMDYKGRLTPKQLAQLVDAAQKAVLGQLDGPKGG